MLRKFLMASVALAALSAPALAADMPVKAQRAIPMQMYNWTGFYVGVHGGYGWADLGTPGFGNSNQDGGFVGGQLGYNWQAVGSPWVLGIELDSAWADLSQTSVVTLGGVTAAAQSETNYLGSLRGRLGYTITPTAMIYGTVGLGWARNELSSAVTFPGFFTAGSVSNTHFGVAAGAGIEWAFAGPWSAKVEYMYYGLGNETYGNLNTDLDIHTVKVGLNYRFGGGRW